MTQDEAITRLKVYRDYLCKMSSWFDVNEVAKPFNMAIETLEQKNGNWIPHEIQVPWGDGTTDVTMFRCSVCGYEDQDWQSKFCANCGSDMRGDMYGNIN